MSEIVDTLIIGASAAGLAAALCLEEAGAKPTVIEASDAPGAMWRNAYQRLHLHTARGGSGLPFVPMPKSYPRFPSRQQVVDYLEAYARALRSSPRYGVRATAIRREDAHWRVETEAGVFNASNVIVATGNTRVPIQPRWPGIDSFAGQILHASAYRSGEAFRGQRVLVVGFGNSACEIAIDLVEQGAHPTLSVRSAVNVLPRELLGLPVASLGILSQLFPPRVIDAIAGPVLRLATGDPARYGLRRLPYGPIEQIRVHHSIPLIDIGTLALIRQGNIAVRPGVDRVTPAGVVFSDGRSEDYGIIVLATGYRAALADLLPDVPDILDAEGTPLVSGAPTAAPGLYFCGFIVTTGGTLRSIGREAHSIARAISDR